MIGGSGDDDDDDDDDVDGFVHFAIGQIHHFVCLFVGSMMTVGGQTDCRILKRQKKQKNSNNYNNKAKYHYNLQKNKYKYGRFPKY